MTDLFHNWKENRFIVAPNYVFETNHLCRHLIVLTDIEFWANRVDELNRWCEEYGCRTQGMTVEVPTDELLTTFCLRWR